MADYKTTGFDTYGYVEEIHFTTLGKQCGIEYGKPLAEVKLDGTVGTFVSQDNIEQLNLTLPKCKCLRK